MWHQLLALLRQSERHIEVASLLKVDPCQIAGGYSKVGIDSHSILVMLSRFGEPSLVQIEIADQHMKRRKLRLDL